MKNKYEIRMHTLDNDKFRFFLNESEYEEFKSNLAKGIKFFKKENEFINLNNVTYIYVNLLED